MATSKTYKLTVVVTEDIMRAAFGLFDGDPRCHQLNIVELDSTERPAKRRRRPRGSNAKRPEPRNETIRQSVRWVDGLWPYLQPIFAAANGAGIKAGHPDLIAVMREIGRSPTSLPSVLSTLHRLGKLNRNERGSYHLPS